MSNVYLWYNKHNDILRPTTRQNSRDLGYIMMACIILHNMIVENERDNVGATNWRTPQSESLWLALRARPNTTKLGNSSRVMKRTLNTRLVGDLINHVYHFDAHHYTKEVYSYDDAPTTPEREDNKDDD